MDALVMVAETTGAETTRPVLVQAGSVDDLGPWRTSSGAARAASEDHPEIPDEIRVHLNILLVNFFKSNTFITAQNLL